MDNAHIQIGDRFEIPVWSGVEITAIFPRWYEWRQCGSADRRGTVPKSLLPLCEELCVHWNFADYCLDCELSLGL